MKYEKALDFLLFSYFGCDCDADENAMKDSAAHRAYLGSCPDGEICVLIKLYRRTQK